MEVLSGFSKYYPNVRVIFATEDSVGAVTKTTIASLGAHYENEVVGRNTTQGALWKKPVEKVQTNQTKEPLSVTSVNATSYTYTIRSINYSKFYSSGLAMELFMTSSGGLWNAARES